MSPRGSSGSIKRILLVRTDRLGDVILTLPMLPVLRRCFPDAHIAMLLRRYTGGIIEGNPHVNELLWYDDGNTLLPFEEMRSTLRSRGFDVVIVGYPTLRLAWLMFRARIPMRVGTGYRYYSLLFNKRVFEHRKDAKRHEVEYNLNLLQELDCVPDSAPEFHLEIPVGAEARVRDILPSVGVDMEKEIVIVHPGSGGSAREWQASNFGKLGLKLAETRGSQIVVTGGAHEAKQVADVLRASHGRAVSLAGQLSLKELAALIRFSQLFVSNSTGPLHVAAALGVPVIGLYPQHTPMSARRWGPYTDRKAVFTPQKPLDCADCTGTRGEPCACMESITPEEVYHAAVRLLERTEKEIAR